jgi:succinate dehydrogenase/fumarate reductase flavoprotein subunit
MLTALPRLGPAPVFDVAVIGAGGAGMSAAVMAAADGARVLLVEATAHLGGTTALSAGTTWVVGSHHAAGVNPRDSVEQAATFLDHAVGGRADPALRAAFLRHGADAVAKIEQRSHLRYRARPLHPDYLSELPGSTLCGRALEPLPFDGRLLGDDLALLRPPIPEFTVLGGMAVDRDDIFHLLRLRRSWASLRYVAKILARHAGDRLRGPRGTRLLMGNALIGRLMLSARERGITVMTDTRVTALHRDGGSVDGLTIEQAGQRVRVAVTGGIVMATGGFNRHPQRRAQRLPGIDATWSPAAPGHTGTLHELAEAVGAHYAPTGLSDAFWAPVSTRRRPDGSTAAFPHFVFDRAKPGMVTVNQAGRRFVNESTSYHLFGLAMQAAHRQSPSIPAYLITDANGLRRYGLGMVRPGGHGLAPYLADGYLTRASTLDALAATLGIDAAGLRDTVARLNTAAQTGVDPDWQRGSTDYQRANGDAAWPGPNPTLGPIDTGPFYAVKLYPGDIGAATGFATDTDARALDTAGRPIPGLYAVGNDAQSIMGGTYPGPGITIGPGLVFAYLAARDAVGRSRRAGLKTAA